MKHFVYISCALMTMEMLHAAASSHAPAAGQAVYIDLISNGLRTRLASGCHSPITGMLWNCRTDSDAEGVLEINIPSPGLDGKNVEKLVGARVPFRGEERIGHLRTRNGIFYITRTDTHVFVEKQHHEVVKEAVRFPLPQDVAVINLLVEFSTKGQCVVSCPRVDTSRPAELATVSQHLPPENLYHQAHGKRSHR